MKKILIIIILIFTCTLSYASISLQVPPPPPPPEIVPFAAGDPGGPQDDVDPKRVPIDFIVPFLLISAILLSTYAIKKNKAKTA